jgi:RNA polymerase sigma factor (sigma-70 family)
LNQQKCNSSIIWERLKIGDVNALGEIYDLFIDDLISFGSQFSNDKHYVMDCIHDVFLDLYKYRKNLASTDNVKFYVYRSLKNKILKKSKEKVLHTPLSTLNENGAFQNYTESFEESIISKEVSDERTSKLSRAITFLSKKQKQGLFLRYQEERDYEEIATILDISVESSRTMVYRAIKSLRNQLAIFILVFQIIFH